MYGLINNALKNMITENFGGEKWDEVLAASGIPEDSFLIMRRYDDAHTYALAGAAAEVLQAPVEDCLEMFGEYWVLHTAPDAYGMVMDAAGADMVEFLHNLNSLHDRITNTFIGYVPPLFRLEPGSGGRYLVHYESSREGLSSFVVGLLKGLAKRFDTEFTLLSQQELPVEKGSHVVFEVEIGTP